MVKSAVLLSFLLFFSSSVVAPTPSEAFFGKKSRERRAKRRAARKAKREPRQTAANVAKPCPQGCTENVFKSEPLRSIPQEENIGSGALKALTVLYGTCEAAKPLKRIKANDDIRHPAYKHLDATNSPKIGKLKGFVHIPGFDAGKESNPRSLREVTNSKDFLHGGPYGAALKEQDNMCPSNSKQEVNPATTPKVFGYGASGHLNKKGEYDLFSCAKPSYTKRLSAAGHAYRCGTTKKSNHSIALDCAEFIGAAAVASCKKLHKNQTINSKGFSLPVEGKKKELGTRSLVATAESKSSKSCLASKSNVSISAPLKEGDVFASSGKHALMITKVGSDPLGVQKGLKKGCKNMTFYDFNFDMAHSASHGGLGPINSSARNYAVLVNGIAKAPAYPLNKILVIARRMCEDARRGKKSSVVKDPKDRAALSLIRHKSDDPACSYPAGKCPELAGHDCADHCEERGFL